MKDVLIICLILINLAAFALFALDKSRARRRMWRIPEATLLTVAALGGSLGALLGIHFLRHKTKHMKFTILVPMFLLIHAAFFSYLFWRLA